MKIGNKFIIALFFTTVAGSSFAADTTSVESKNLTLLKTLWSSSSNAAGLGIDKLRDNGEVSIGYFYKEGSYHRAQQGSSGMGMTFDADSYVKLSNKFYGYGSFSFGMDRENDRAWSDMRKTYNGNPYTYGSAIKGKYDNQRYELSAKVGSVEFGRISFGASLDYRAYDMSRLKDPRPRTLAAEYAISPSIIFRLTDKSRIGADFAYEFNKDRMSGITKVQSIVFEYFKFSGLENHLKLTEITSFEQQQIAEILKGGLSYSLDGENYRWLLSASYSERQEDVIHKERRSPGDYFEQRLRASSKLVLWGERSLQTLDIAANYGKGSAQEFIQEQQNVTNPNGNVSTKWVTIYSNTTYKTENRELKADYRLYKGAVSQDDYAYYVGLGGEFNGFSNKFVLPISVQEVDLFRANANFGFRAINKKDKLHFNFRAAMQMNLKNRLEVSENNVIVENILNPDKLFFGKKNIEGYADIIYSFRVGKGKNSKTAFAKGFYNAIFAGKQSWTNVGFSVGLYL